MTYDPATNSPDRRATPPAEAAAPKWPVLARLPWVGEPQSQSSDDRVRHAHMPTANSGPRQDQSPPKLRIAETPAETSRAYVDRAQSTASYEMSLTSVAIEPLIRDISTQQRRHRIDPANVRRPAAITASVQSISPGEQSHTFAARVFQWHASLAPYAGVILTFLLAFSAGLLYWAALGRSQVAPASGDAFEAPIWTSESLDPTTIGQHDWQNAPATGEIAEFSWSQTPKADDAPAVAQPSDDESIALETAAPLAAELQTAKTHSANPDEPKPSAPQPSPPAPTTAGQATAAADVSAAKSTAPFSITYPTTPFASFDFGLTPPENAPAPAAIQTSQEIVAERPAEGPNPPPSTR